MYVYIGFLYPCPRRAAALLNVEPDSLVNAMSFRRIKAGHEWFTVYSDSKKCHHLREALCKAVYSGLFDWLVKKVRLGNRYYWVGYISWKSALGVCLSFHVGRVRAGDFTCMYLVGIWEGTMLDFPRVVCCEVHARSHTVTNEDYHVM